MNGPHSVLPPARPADARAAGARVSASTVIAAALLVHAVLALAGVARAPAWLPFVECLAASVIGLRWLRRHDARSAADEGASVPARRSA